MTKALKIEFNSVCKKLPVFPETFQSLVDQAMIWTQIDPETFKIHFIDPKTNFEIVDESSYREFQSLVTKTAKISVIKKERNDNPPPKKEEIMPLTNSNRKEKEVIVFKDSFEENQNKEEDEEIKKSINNYLDAKLNEIGDNIVNQLCSKIIEKSKISNISKIQNNIIIHKGIICSNCNKSNITGARYKCTKCINYNLCEECESKGVHDMYHILLKINYPTDESTLEQINKNYKYSIEQYNYRISIRIFTIKFDENNKTQKIFFDIKNTGTAVINQGFTLVHLEESQIKAPNVRMLRPIPPNLNGAIEILLDLSNCTYGSYDTFWQMRNTQGVFFGEVTKITIIIE